MHIFSYKNNRNQIESVFFGSFPFNHQYFAQTKENVEGTFVPAFSASRNSATTGCDGRDI